MSQRNPYLIARAFKNYLWASLLSSAATQLAITVDAMISGHFIGSDALSAISLIIPITTVMAAVSTLIGAGPAIMASKAIGNQKYDKVNYIFTTAMLQALIVGIIICSVTYFFSSDIALMLCNEPNLLPYLKDYLSIVPFGFFANIFVASMGTLVEANGKPKLFAQVVCIGCFTNILLDIIFVKYMGMGIKGAAWAMVANNMLTAIILGVSMVRGKNGYSFKWPKKNMMEVTKSGLNEGLPIMLNDFIYSFTLLAINWTILNVCGKDAILQWAICMQILVIVMVVVDGAEGAILSVGGMLVGEDDKVGMWMLAKRLVRAISMMAGGVAIIIWIFPDAIVSLFDGHKEDMLADWKYISKVFSIMLIPYAISTWARSLFQILELRMSAIVFTIIQLILTMACMYGISFFVGKEHIWWGLPVSATLVLLSQFIYLKKKIREDKFTVFSNQQDTSSRKTMELSVEYNKEAVVEAIGQMETFLQKSGCDTFTEMAVNICSEELMLNIVKYQSHRRNPYMDLYISVTDGKVNLCIKDAGRPFNPVIFLDDVENTEDYDSNLGLKIINRISTKLTHKYMYGQNVVNAEFNL